MEKPEPAYEGEEPYVFVSYSHEDEEPAYREIRWLQDQGVKVWYDTQIQAGSEWSDALANAISGCSRFLYFITPNSVASENCRRELNHALEEGRSVLAVHLVSTEVPPGIRLNLNNRQAILKHRLKPEDYRSILLGALSTDRSAPKPRAAAGVSLSNRNVRLISGIAAMLLVAVTSAVWFWQRTSVEPAPNKSADSTEAPLTAIAVLPFDDLSPDSDHAWLANGMAEDLIEALGRIEGLHVPARRSTAIVKESGADLPTIGERLDVGTVVEGSVRRYGDELSVLVRWIRVSDGASLWSARFEREFDDVLEIQYEIIVGIAESIRTELGIQDALPLLARERYEASDVRAWELLKRAVPLAETLEPAKVAEAKKLLRLAIEHDPQFTAAYAQLAVIESREDIDQGLEQYKAIMEMDPSYRAVFAGFAWDSAMRYWDYETAMRLLRRIPKDRKTAQTLDIDFWVFANAGQLKEALSAAQRAQHLDPIWARTHCLVGYMHEAEGEWKSALTAYQMATSVAKETGQGGIDCAGNLADVYHHLGRDEEAVEAFVHAERSPLLRQRIMSAWKTGGWQGVNLVILDTIPDTWCIGLARRGAVERMYECLDAAVAQTDTNEPGSSFTQTVLNLVLASIAWRSEFTSYRDQPRFRAILRRLDDRMEKAAGTYERKVGFELPQ